MCRQPANGLRLLAKRSPFGETQPIMTWLYSDPVFQTHVTGNHPEHPERLARVLRHLQWTGLDVCCLRTGWEPATEAELGRVHTTEHIASIRDLAASGGGCLDPDTVVSGCSYEVSRMAAGAVCDAVRRVLAARPQNALCLVRPPGHHASPSTTMGFCLFNSIAVAARMAIAELQLDRVLIVDWDVHHGNGTQDIFWDDDRVAVYSIHRAPFFPETGAADETGRGAGRGWTRNVPIAFGTPRSMYLDRFRASLEDFADRVRPQLVLVSAGFDAHRLDPIGSLGLETEDFGVLTQVVLEIADVHAGGALVSTLEGGYDPGALTDCVDVHLETLLEHCSPHQSTPPADRDAAR